VKVLSQSSLGLQWGDIPGISKMYIDPGSGSMAFQFLVAGALGFILTFWKRIRDRFRQLLGQKITNKP